MATAVSEVDHGRVLGPSGPMRPRGRASIDRLAFLRARAASGRIQPPMKCPACAKTMSDAAAKCPACGTAASPAEIAFAPEDALRGRLVDLQLAAYALMLVGLLLQFGGLTKDVGDTQEMWLLGSGALLIALGCALHAANRGHSPSWGLAGAMSIFGAAFMWVFLQSDPRCARCGEQLSGREDRCPGCSFVQT